MVEAHEAWEAVDGGYHSEDAFLTISGVHIRETGKDVNIDESAHAVRMQVGSFMDDVASFEDEEVAQEFLRLLTHYFEANEHGFTDYDRRRRELLDAEGPHMQGTDQFLPTIVRDLSAAEAFEIALEPYPVPDAMQSILE